VKLLVFLCCLLLTDGVSAEIYKWLDEQGRVQFGDRPPPGKKQVPLELEINTYNAPEIVYTPPEPRKKQGRTPKVVMYSAEWCGVCKQARSYFKRNKIRYMEYDIDKSAEGRTRYRELNGRGVPIIMVGKSRMNGFSPAHFDQLYQ
jgi:glutaredoxin